MSTLLPSTAAGGGPTSRLEGVDVARALALLAMMSVHILPDMDADGHVTTAFVLSAGRASALFALLAGTGLALVTGAATPHVRPWRPVAAGVLTRAALIAVLGLVLAEMAPPVAVILTNYGLLFVVALVALRLSPTTLVALAAGWVVATPLLSHWLRGGLPPGPGAQPSITLLLTHPVEVARALTLTGYYPVLQWSAYLFVGVAVGRLPLARVRTSARLVVVGLAVAVVSRIASDQLLARGGLTALRAAGPAELVPTGSAGEAVDQLQLLGRYGVPPTTTWWWQAVAAPHTGTPFDLAHTIGSALVLLGIALLVVHAARSGPARIVLRGPLAVLAATGSMTLTLYTLHVIALAARIGPMGERPQLLLLHVVLAVVFATIWRATHSRGPLEQLVHHAATAARRSAGGGGRSPDSPDLRAGRPPSGTSGPTAGPRAPRHTPSERSGG